MEEQIFNAQNGNTEAMENLIHENIGLIWSIVRRFSNRGYDVEDLFQIGVIGFMKSIKRFDTKLNLKLSTYAVSMMIGEIKRFLRDDGIIKVSRSLKELNYKILEIKEYHLKQFGVELSIEEISSMLHVEKEDVILSMESSNMVESLDKPLESKTETESLYNRISHPNDDYEQLLNKMVLEEAFQNLNSLEKRVIIYRYYRDMTQSQIASLMGTSQVQISRMEHKALSKMKMCVK